LSDLGITIAVDNFGRGLSSLIYLRSFPVSILKLDRGLVAELLETPAGLPVLRGVVDLAHAMGMAVTAEGVESVDRFNALRDAGCDRAQGFLWAAPARPDGLAASLVAMYERRRDRAAR
jgi:Amt family ammonium transporter